MLSFKERLQKSLKSSSDLMVRDDVKKILSKKPKNDPDHWSVKIVTFLTLWVTRWEEYERFGPQSPQYYRAEHEYRKVTHSIDPLIVHGWAHQFQEARDQNPELTPKQFLEAYKKERE